MGGKDGMRGEGKGEKRRMQKKGGRMMGEMEDKINKETDREATGREEEREFKEKT